MPRVSAALWANDLEHVCAVSLINFKCSDQAFTAVISCVATMLGGILVALIYCWRIALVVLGACPAVAIGGALQMKLMTGFSQSKEFEASSK